MSRWILTPYMVVVWASAAIYDKKRTRGGHSVIPGEIEAYVLSILVIAAITLVIRMIVLIIIIVLCECLRCVGNSPGHCHQLSLVHTIDTSCDAGGTNFGACS